LEQKKMLSEMELEDCTFKPKVQANNVAPKVSSKPVVREDKPKVDIEFEQ
jgi:hypothetical protein